MSDLTHEIRFQGLARKEFAITPLGLSGETPQEFTTGLALGYSRIGCYAYNNSDPASGEFYWGNALVSPRTGFPIPVGSVVEIPIAGELSFYLCASGERVMDARILEIS